MKNSNLLYAEVTYIVDSDGNYNYVCRCIRAQNPSNEQRYYTKFISLKCGKKLKFVEQKLSTRTETILAGERLNHWSIDQVSINHKFDLIQSFVPDHAWNVLNKNWIWKKGIPQLYALFERFCYRLNNNLLQKRFGNNRFANSILMMIMCFKCLMDQDCRNVASFDQYCRWENPYFCTY